MKIFDWSLRKYINKLSIEAQDDKIPLARSVTHDVRGNTVYRGNTFIT